MQIIPFQEIAAFTMQITLTNVIFLLSFKWNALNAYWVMSIYDRDGNALVVGIKIVTNYDLTAQYVVPGLPAGQIVCQNIINEWFDIGRFDMGETTELIYYEPGEIASQVATLETSST